MPAFVRPPRPSPLDRRALVPVLVLSLAAGAVAAFAASATAAAAAAKKRAASTPLAAAKASGLIAPRVLAWVAGGPEAASGFVLVGTRGVSREVVAASLPPEDGRLTLVSLAVVAKKGRVEASVAPFLDLPNLYEVHVRERVRVKGGAETMRSRHAILRVPIAGGLELACAFAGSGHVTPGAKCGSGSSDSVSVRAVKDPARALFEVHSEGAGRWSERVGAKCVERSPVRATPKLERYEIPAVGRCTATKGDSPAGSSIEF